MNSRSWEDGLTQSIAGLVILLLILAVIAGAWLSVRAANQVARGLAADGTNKLLWAALAIFLSVLAAAVATASQVLLVAAGIALLVLLIMARSVELLHTETFQAPPSLEDLRHDMLHEWWPTEDAA
jgi:hypothetical protein